MRETPAPGDQGMALQPEAPRRPDAAEMWENMWLADELLDECELLAAVRAVRTPDSSVPSDRISPAGGEGARVPVLDLADLIRLKLEAGGPKDLWDVARLLRRYPEERTRTLGQASSLGVEKELQRWLERE